MAGLLDLINPPSVRRLIDASYTERDLDDEVVRDSIFTGPAIAELLRLDPDSVAHAAEDDEKKGHIKNALNRLIAALILPTIPIIEKEDFGDGGGWSRQKVNITERVSALQQQAADDISNVIGVDSSSSSETPPAFLVVQ